MVSWIFDQLYYPYLLEKVPEITSRAPYYFVMVPLVFFSSIALSWVLEIIQTALTFIWAKTIEKLRSKRIELAKNQ